MEFGVPSQSVVLHILTDKFKCKHTLNLIRVEIIGEPYAPPEKHETIEQVALRYKIHPDDDGVGDSTTDYQYYNWNIAITQYFTFITHCYSQQHHN
jgi:hypothetical protein